MKMVEGEWKHYVHEQGTLQWDYNDEPHSKMIPKAVINSFVRWPGVNSIGTEHCVLSIVNQRIELDLNMRFGKETTYKPH
jgi:hypothetical protein